ncbi:MAG: aspartate kinase [Spirochaetales bacterium]|jgi:bifunctional aspartokinase / homoserine dehydrogenase 1|nr:aspartate kinase [Spirochaetales bacterium]
MKIMKFGGSSVRDAERIQAACAIAVEESKNAQVVTVFSAMKGVTDLLILAAEEAEAADLTYRSRFTEIEKKHLDTAAVLLSSEAGASTRTEIQKLLGELSSIFHGIELVRECSPRSMDLVMGFGERLSCTLIAAYLVETGTEASFVDARDCIVTNQRHGSAVVDFKATNDNISKCIAPLKGIPVVTGFIAATPDGVTTTLGRNGSDYTASILGAGLDADTIEIWTDVDGVLSADPRSVENTFVIDQLSVEEAMELSFFGAEVIHPYTMIPAVEKNIPLRIRNTLNPSAIGTLIASEVERHKYPITGIASIENCSLVNVEGGGMMGMPGVASRVFQALARAEVNIVMISQASSEHSICIVCRNREALAAVDALEAEFSWELNSKKINRIEHIDGLEIIAIIGENMRGTPGISGMLFNALGVAKINVLAIAQGSTERNISFVIHSEDRKKALSAVHKVFFEQADA